MSDEQETKGATVHVLPVPARCPRCGGSTTKEQLDMRERELDLAERELALMERKLELFRKQQEAIRGRG